MRALLKTTIVIWSEIDSEGMNIADLAQDAIGGESYCSKEDTKVINDPESDPDWDDTEFFGNDDDDDDGNDDD
jgi:hypothetical protein